MTDEWELSMTLEVILSTLGKIWKVILTYVLGRLGLEVVYYRATFGMESRLASANHLSTWWLIFLLFPIADFALLAGLVWFVRLPLREKLGDRYPLRNILADLAILVLLISLTNLWTDPLVYPVMVNLGLEPIHWTLRFSWMLWAAVLLLRLANASRSC
jgi:hypothetical protein